MEELDEIEEKLYDQGDYEYAEQRLIELNNEHPGDSRIILDYKLCECFKNKGVLDDKEIVSIYKEFVSIFDNSELKDAARTMITELIIRGLHYKLNYYGGLLERNLSITMEDEEEWAGLFNCFDSSVSILTFLLGEDDSNNFDLNIRDTIYRGLRYCFKHELLFVNLPKDTYEKIERISESHTNLMNQLGIE